jgi:hypothetical protein
MMAQKQLQQRNSSFARHLMLQTKQRQATGTYNLTPAQQLLSDRKNAIPEQEAAADTQNCVLCCQAVVPYQTPLKTRTTPSMTAQKQLQQRNSSFARHLCFKRSSAKQQELTT